MKHALALSQNLDRLGTETAFAVSEEAARYAAGGREVYPFHLGDINVPTPANIVEAANRAIRDGKTGYCPSAGIPALREALAEDVGTRRGISYQPDEVSIQPGGKPVIGKFIAAIMNPGDEVLYPNPGYPIYESQIEYQGGKAVPYPYVKTDAGFDIDLGAIGQAVGPQTKALIINNYQNPTGAECSAEELQALAEIALEHDLWVLSDEAYFEIRYEGAARSIASLPGMKERTVILYTFSKKYAMTGWRLGAAIGPKPIIDVFNKLNVNMESCSNHFIQWAMVEGLRGSQEGPIRILSILKERRDAAVAGLNTIQGIQIAPPRTTFYLFPEVTEILKRKGLTDVEALRSGALQETGVSFCTRVHFGRPMPGEESAFVRLAYSGIDRNRITAGLSRLKEYFERALQT